MSDITSKTIEQASVCLDQMAKRINAASFVCVCATLKARIDQDDNLARSGGSWRLLLAGRLSTLALIGLGSLVL